MSHSHHIILIHEPDHSTLCLILTPFLDDDFSSSIINFLMEVKIFNQFGIKYEVEGLSEKTELNLLAHMHSNYDTLTLRTKRCSPPMMNGPENPPQRLL